MNVGCAPKPTPNEFGRFTSVIFLRLLVFLLSQVIAVLLKSTLIRNGWRVLRAVLIAYLLIVLLMALFEESLLFFPDKYPVGDWNPAGLNFEDAWFDAADGTRLHGWFVPHDNPRAVVLFAHGNAGNITGRDDILRSLHRMGVAVLAFDYRGYGRSEGSPNEAGILGDGRAARTWLAKRVGIPESDIVLMGESLGGAVAALLAAETPARGLVLENTFSSAPDVAAYHYPWLPVKQLMRTQLNSSHGDWSVSRSAAASSWRCRHDCADSIGQASF